MLVKFNIFPTRCSSLLTLIQETLGTGFPDTSQPRLYGWPSIAAFEDLTTLSTDEESAIKFINLIDSNFFNLCHSETLNLLSGKLTCKFKYYLKHSFSPWCILELEASSNASSIISASRSILYQISRLSTTVFFNNHDPEIFRVFSENTMDTSELTEYGAELN